MSEPIPESIPTSSDPRSKRPIKKRALTPVSSQAASLDALFAKPEQEIKVPSSTSRSLTTVQHGAPPEIVANVQGSSAGAGSGEFHVYKASRRREYERLRAMDEEVRQEKELEGWEKEKRDREERDREKTRKNRERRERLKKGKGKGRTGNVADGLVREGKIKARVDSGKAINGGTGDEDMNGGVQAETKAEADNVKGLIIHDDD